MDRARAIEEIRKNVDMTDYLIPAGGANQFVCPFCGSGDHGRGSTAAFHYYPETNTGACFSTACTKGTVTGKSYDVFDVVGQYYGTDFNGAFQILADKLGIEIDNAAGGINTPPKAKNAAGGEFGPNNRAANAAETPADHTAYYKECADRITDPRAVSYLTGRGISLETAQAHGLGFDPEADPINAPGGQGQHLHPEPRIIAPMNKYHYVGRALRTVKGPDGADYTKPNNKGSRGHTSIFNAQCIYEGARGPIFVTEGLFDALSILEAGYKAIALNSANMAHLLIEQVNRQEPTAATHFIICLDNDNAGQTATRTLAAGLKYYTVANISGPYKDPNEHLVKDRVSFLSAVETAAKKRIKVNDVFGDYFNMCGINPRTAAEHGASYDTGAGQIVIPCEDTATYKIHAFRSGRPEYSASIAKPFGLSEALRGRDQGECRPIIVVWNPVDALAMIEDDYRAVALCNYTAADYFISQVCEARPKEPIVLAVTGDTRDRIRAHLATAGLTVYTTDLQGSYDTIWQHRLHDREGYKAAADAAGRGEPTGVSDYIATALVEDIEDFKTDIKTGFENFDRETGGLYSGLYVVGAISSLGKTTFVHQMADQIAESGGHVLFFSLEQSRFELVTKSIARESYLVDAWSAYSAMDVRRMRGKMDRRAATIMAQYASKVENRLQIIESTFDCTAGQIEQTAREYMARNKVTPVIIVDYLQVLQPEPDAVQTDIRSTVDAALTRFKRLAADTGATVIVVSSINRQNYSAPIDFSGLKESGRIEYTADCVIGLQLEVMNARLFTQDKKEINKRTLAEVAKKQIPRRIEAKILKNRYGATRFSVNFEYNPVFDTFVPCEPMSAAELTALEKEAEKLVKERTEAAARAERAEAITL